MNTTIYDLDKLVSIKVVGKKQSANLIYKPFSKNKWNGDRLEGFYHKVHDYDYYYSMTEVEKSTTMYAENLILYYKPYVELRFVNNSTHVEHFNTDQEALLWAQNKAHECIKIQYIVNSE